MKILVWLRQDLRLADNPALRAAAQEGEVIPLYIWSPEEEGEAAPGEAGKWWLSRSLDSLEGAFSKLGGKIVRQTGPALEVLQELLKQTKASAVFWNQRYEPSIRKRDEKIIQKLKGQGIDVRTFNASLLVPPLEIYTRENKPFQVFTPFWNALQKQAPFRSHPFPSQIAFPHRFPASQSFQIAEPGNGKTFNTFWKPGEPHAWETLENFIDSHLADYAHERDRPDHEGVSRLSPYLHFGEISPRQIWERISGKKGGGRFFKGNSLERIRLPFNLAFPSNNT